jgi:hypothetical protein
MSRATPSRPPLPFDLHVLCCGADRSQGGVTSSPSVHLHTARGLVPPPAYICFLPARGGHPIDPRRPLACKSLVCRSAQKRRPHLGPLGTHFPRGHAALEDPTSGSGTGTLGGLPSIAYIFPHWCGRGRRLPRPVSLCLSFLIPQPLPPPLPFPPRVRQLFPPAPGSSLSSHPVQVLTFSPDCLTPRHCRLPDGLPARCRVMPSSGRNT